jgi:hypothetical protein
MSIIPINFSSETHKEYILKLCKRNNFYYDDVFVNLNYNNHELMKKKLKLSYKLNFNVIVPNNTLEDTAKKLTEKMINRIRQGFLIITKVNEKNMVVGFLIFDTDLKKVTSDLLFILVDKSFIKQGFGTSLLVKYNNECLLQQIHTQHIKTEDCNLIDWYTRNQYQTVIPLKINKYYHLLKDNTAL